MGQDLFGLIEDLTLDEVETHPAPVRWAFFRALGWSVVDRRWIPARASDHGRIWS